jgi:hypothetical protein
MNDITKRTPSTPSTPSASRAASFLAAAVAADKAAGRGRLIFALDATGSRKPTWDMACKVQAEMFEEAMLIGRLDVQLVYYRGLGECGASLWVSRPERLAELMGKIDCRSGATQIGRVLAHAAKETQINKVQALVFVGDAMEEQPDELAHAASELGRLNTPAFMFQEGDDPKVEQAFREIARLTHGAWTCFDPNAPHELAELLRGAATFAVGGVDALRLSKSTASATKLLSQLK